MTVNIQLEKSKLNALRQFTDFCIIPFLAKNGNSSDVKYGVLGTGVLFKFNSRSFIVSAAHVIELCQKNQDKVGIPLTLKGSDVYTLGHCRTSMPDDIGIRDKLDIAFLELSNEHLQKFSSDYKLLSYENIEKKLINTKILIKGYPDSYSIKLNSKAKIESKPLRLMTTQYSVEETVRIPEKNEYCFFEKWNKTYDEFVNGFENTQTNKILGDISGKSNMQYYLNNQDYDSANSIKIIGIQVSVKEKVDKGVKNWIPPYYSKIMMINIWQKLMSL